MVLDDVAAVVKFALKRLRRHLQQRPRLRPRPARRSDGSAWRIASKVRLEQGSGDRQITSDEGRCLGGAQPLLDARPVHRLRCGVVLNGTEHDSIAEAEQHVTNVGAVLQGRPARRLWSRPHPDPCGAASPGDRRRRGCAVRSPPRDGVPHETRRPDTTHGLHDGRRRTGAVVIRPATTGDTADGRRRRRPPGGVPPPCSTPRAKLRLIVRPRCAPATRW